jgi:hypothetical protein
MNLYRQAITLFGIVVPVIIALLVVGGFYYLRSEMTASFNNKKQNFKLYEQNRQASLTIEAQVKQSRQHLDRWNEALSQETASIVTTNMREIFAKLPTKEIQQTSFERTNAGGGFGAVSAQKSSQIRIALRGTYRTLQQALAELETRMPQLQLMELRMDPSTNPSTNQANQINFQATYTVWES